jgi:predicted pyridoxine 5'-phosphate oxidase superfamily flavin-nucleotide-binding protein
MPTYGAIAYTPSVRAAQRRMGSPVALSTEDADEDFALSSAEAEFIATRDGFFQATTSETGWPYVQYRGGPPGFVQVLSPVSIGYANLRGNRQYVSAGNLSYDDRVALFFIDYATQRRFKAYGHARFIDDGPVRAMLARTADRGRVEQGVIIDLVAGAWNCPQHITPRWTSDEIATAVEPLRTRIAELEAELASLKSAT